MDMSCIDTTRGSGARVRVTIDRVVLRGMEPATRTSFVEGLRQELARVLGDASTRATLWRGAGARRVPVLRLGQVRLEPGTSGARMLGRSVARAIGGSGSVAKGVRR